MADDVISKLDSLDKSDRIRVKTSEEHEVEGSIEIQDVRLDCERPRDRCVYVDVIITESRADELGSIWCKVSLFASRRRDGWTDLEATVVTEVDEDNQTEDEKSLGVVETVERID